MAHINKIGSDTSACALIACFYLGYAQVIDSLYLEHNHTFVFLEIDLAVLGIIEGFKCIFFQTIGLK